MTDDRQWRSAPDPRRPAGPRRADRAAGREVVPPARVPTARVPGRPADGAVRARAAVPPRREPELLTHERSAAAGRAADVGAGGARTRDGRGPDGRGPDGSGTADGQAGRAADGRAADGRVAGGRAADGRAGRTPTGRRGRPRRPRSRWRTVRRLVLTGVLLGILAPIVAFAISWFVYDVPSPESLAQARKQVTTVYYSDGVTEIGRYVPEGDGGNRVEVRLDDVPLHVRNAVLSAEDRSFYSNPGFDVFGIFRAAWKQLRGGTGGGSTITQQYVKVATGDDDYSLFRKWREVVVAAKMTKENSKDQIFEDYLNTIYFGRNAYGIQAASRAYFGKDVALLTPSEGALLAGVIQAPSRWDPAKNPGQAQFRWGFVLDGMVEEGWLPAADRAAQLFPVTVPPEEVVTGVTPDDRMHIVDRVLGELEEKGIRREELDLRGGRIVTTIDARAQQLARDAVLQQLADEPPNLRSSLVAVDPRTGAIRAYFGGMDGAGYDLAGGPAWNPGSSFKPFTMLAALEEGIGINSVYDGDSPLTVQGIEYANSESQPYPDITLRDAMTKSVNTTFIQLTDEVGASAVRDAAIQAGIPDTIEGKTSLVEPGESTPGLGISLGQYPVHTVDMAAAYSTFAADGIRRTPHLLQEYVDADGTSEYRHTDDGVAAFDPEDAERNTQLARNVTATLTGVADSSRFPLDDGREVAAKTGTHQRGDTGTNAAAWTVGYTPSISTAVWVGDPANGPIKTSQGKNIFGSGVPADIWQQFMDAYLAGTPEEDFPDYELLGEAVGRALEEETEAPEPSQPPSTITLPPPLPTDLLPPGLPFDPTGQDPSQPCFPFCPRSTEPNEPQLPGYPDDDGGDMTVEPGEPDPQVPTQTTQPGRPGVIVPTRPGLGGGGQPGNG